MKGTLNMKNGKSFLFILLFVFIPLMFMGDVIILNSGTRQEGLVRDVSDNPDQILFVNGTGEVKINRNKIRKIEKEEEYISWMKVADQLFALKDYKGALEDYNKAKELAPDNDDIDDRIKMAQDEIKKIDLESKEKNRKEVDDLLKQSEEFSKQKEFEKAEMSVKKALTLMPSDQQKKEINSFLSNMYYDWAISDLDHVRPDSAAVKLEKVREIDPENLKAIKKLLDLWENNPIKTDMVIEAYESLLKQDPNNLSLKRKLADLNFKKGYEEKALQYYLDIYNNDEAQRAGIRDTLKNLFINSCNKAANEKNFNKAKEIYQKYCEIFPSADPTPIDIYEFADKLINLQANDIDGRIALIQFAKSKKLDVHAKELINSILASDPKNPKALAELNFYAQNDLQEAKQFFNIRQYWTAQSAFKKIIDEYPLLPDVIKEAGEFYERSQYESKKLDRAKKEQAQEIVSLGDSYYNKATYHLEMWRRTDVNKNIRVISDKDEAIKNLKRAVAAYETALSIDPSLGTLAGGDLNSKIADSKSKLSTLLYPISLPMPKYGTLNK